ncbi:uncharacterized protein YukE, partial [Streptomyces sp. LBL]|uniref:WXG100 family type VII secretion target n=1 Tax=Streptomyces sp. LBL TaxID=2940562 RepID=UPI002475368F
MADKERKGTHDDGPVDLTGDYSDWDWRKIKSAITGGADGEDAQYDLTLSDPQTLQDAGNAFYYTQKVLEDVARSLSEQSDALAGEGRPWQGQAAQAFTATMGSFAKQVTAMANVLSGGATGHHNVPQQLADNAQHLREAIAKVGDIDVWYANQAIKVDPSLKMDNGLVMVSKAGKIPQMMADDMRQVLVALAKHYTLTKDAVVQPEAPSVPTSSSPSGESVNGLTPIQSGTAPANSYADAEGQYSSPLEPFAGVSQDGSVPAQYADAEGQYGSPLRPLGVSQDGSVPAQYADAEGQYGGPLGQVVGVSQSGSVPAQYADAEIRYGRRLGPFVGVSSDGSVPAQYADAEGQYSSPPGQFAGAPTQYVPNGEYSAATRGGLEAGVRDQGEMLPRGGLEAGVRDQGEMLPRGGLEAGVRDQGEMLP